MGAAVRKQCIECKRTMKGDASKMQWCDCGGEMRKLPYGPRKRKITRGR